MSAIDVVSALVWRSRPEPALLLQYRINTPGHARHWAAPGGKVEPGESPDAAITRELAEEIGVHFVPRSGPAYTYRIDSGLVFAGYLVEAWAGEVENREPGFCARLDWFAPGALPAPLTPGTQALFDLAGIR